MGQRLLTYEEISTLIARIEICLNSRPLTPSSGEVGDIQALTLVTGFPLTSLPEPDIYLSENPDRTTHWRLVRSLRNQFSVRWSREYLHNLQRRAKWRQPQRNFGVGDLVLVMDTSLLRHLDFVLDFIW